MDRTSLRFNEDEMMGLLEERLKASLNPIRPDPAFVHRLKYRLVTPPRITIEARRKPVLLLLLLLFGLLSGITIVWFVRRN
jgi:hypothetical protein